MQDAIDAANLWDLDRKVAQSMDALRCPPPDAPTAVLSGGEKRRVALCRLLLENPDMLLLDEPTNHLDCESVAWLERFLADFKGTVVAITHDRYFLENVAQWILELEKGEGKPYEGNYSGWLELKAKRLAVEKRAETALAKQLASELEWVRATPKARQTKSKARLNRYEDLLASAGGGESGPGEGKIFIPPGPRLGDTVINVEHLCKSFGDRQIFQDVNFELPRGAIVGVIGPNGAGKSTMMRMLAAQATDAGGDLVADADGDGTRAPVEGADPRPTVPDWRDQGRRDRRSSASSRCAASCPVRADATVFDVISEEDPLPLGTRDVSARAFVSWFGFRSQEQSKRVQKLSGGERGRVHLARVLKSGANVILLDEPRRCSTSAASRSSSRTTASSDRRDTPPRVRGRLQVRWFEGTRQEYDVTARASARTRRTRDPSSSNRYGPRSGARRPITPRRGARALQAGRPRAAPDDERKLLTCQPPRPQPPGAPGPCPLCLCVIPTVTDHPRGEPATRRGSRLFSTQATMSISSSRGGLPSTSNATPTRSLSPESASACRCGPAF